MKFLTCSLCTKPLYQPVEHTQCRMPFCSACIKDAPQCPECAVPIKQGRSTNAPTRTVQLQLDDLPIRCADCDKQMARGAYEAHWKDSCPIKCPFASVPASDDDAVCTVSLPRSQMNKHIDSCKFAPVQCSAAEFGCTWQGRREALKPHSTSCPYVVCTPDFERLLASLRTENTKLRIALETRDAQLLSYSSRSAGQRWAINTVIDAEDTELQWMLARIKRIDDKRGYYITYLDCPLTRRTHSRLRRDSQLHSACGSLAHFWLCAFLLCFRGLELG